MRWLSHWLGADHLPGGGGAPVTLANEARHTRSAAKADRVDAQLDRIDEDASDIHKNVVELRDQLQQELEVTRKAAEAQARRERGR